MSSGAAVHRREEIPVEEELVDNWRARNLFGRILISIRIRWRLCSRTVTCGSPRAPRSSNTLQRKSISPAYPKVLRLRGKVNEMMDWVNTDDLYYRDFGYGLQPFAHFKLPQREA
jgi:hypothetical protein